jgi:hypothetical protein
LNDPNSGRFCDWSGSLQQALGKISGVPFRSEYTLQTNVPVKWGFELNASLYSDPVYSPNFATPIASSTTSPPLPLTAFSGQNQGLRR